MDLSGKSILVTGGTGSFGRAFVRLLLSQHKPRKLMVFSRDEQKQFDMAQDLPLANHPNLRYFIGDVRDGDRLELAMRDVNIVVHAAAMKHVTIAEYNPFECVRTNINGAENVVKAALRCGVERVIALSTDKASNPVNLYGATKLASDKIFIAANNLSGLDGPRFSVVRYGNVVGSRGSVVPFFRRIIAEGADHLPITDPKMTRFWITLEQGSNFVLSSMAMMQGGEIYVPKIPSMHVTDLARVLAPKLPHRVIGIRIGEKLHETMISEDDARNTVEIDDRFVVVPEQLDFNDGALKQIGARPVDPEFCYASDTNKEWLDGNGMRRLLEESHV
jgi:UDP-N-acetylglucosamine 4,6-dehydratase